MSETRSTRETTSKPAVDAFSVDWAIDPSAEPDPAKAAAISKRAQDEAAAVLPGVPFS
jgi:hypothetical protein